MQLVRIPRVQFHRSSLPSPLSPPVWISRIVLFSSLSDSRVWSMNTRRDLLTARSRRFPQFCLYDVKQDSRLLNGGTAILSRNFPSEGEISLRYYSLHSMCKPLLLIAVLFLLAVHTLLATEYTVFCSLRRSRDCARNSIKYSRRSSNSIT